MWLSHNLDHAFREKRAKHARFKKAHTVTIK